MNNYYEYVKEQMCIAHKMHFLKLEELFSVRIFKPHNINSNLIIFLSWKGKCFYNNLFFSKKAKETRIYYGFKIE